tara:strand:+ start:1542 stop:1781 length:240 start_codon:yes stop_codon:yes gene_type:complete
MKAILIKYLSATNTKGARFKATTDAGSLILPPDCSHDYTDCEMIEIMANKYIDHVGWDCVISGVGSLPNGDYVATLKNR